MGFFDPVWTAVDASIAGAGGAVGGAISSFGDGISATGRSMGDSISGAANGYAGYVNDTANYVRDATGAQGQRKSTAANPLGLSSDKAAARSYGAATPWKHGKSGNAAAQQKPKAVSLTTPSAAKSAQKNIAAKPASSAVKRPAPTTAKPLPKTAAQKTGALKPITSNTTQKSQAVKVHQVTGRNPTPKPKFSTAKSSPATKTPAAPKLTPLQRGQAAKKKAALASAKK